LCHPLILIDVLLTDPRIYSPAFHNWLELEAFDLKGSVYYDDQRPSRGTDSDPKLEGEYIWGF